eukprot:TRINITY_DN50516_c0_g1_i1.p1 TRINITY_DN50516_c0_g1~~TRINITY_DN50516_c0_g1_i1.p1  ORF type:complete len:171 (-),score=24.96 TRINITY_DN50516_c0_g1_i1:7-519(-)
MYTTIHATRCFCVCLCVVVCAMAVVCAGRSSAFSLSLARWKSVLLLLSALAVLQAHGEEEEELKASESEASDSLPRLPSPDDAQASHNMKLGDKFKFDSLGPIIVNKDGTLRRIANWAQLVDVEREGVLKKLLKRNQLRLEALQENASDASNATREAGAPAATSDASDEL